MVNNAAAPPTATSTAAPMLLTSPGVQKQTQNQNDGTFSNVLISVPASPAGISKAATPSIRFQSNIIRQADNMNVQQHIPQQPNQLNTTQILPNFIDSDAGPVITPTSETLYQLADGRILSMTGLLASGFKVVESDISTSVGDDDEPLIVTEPSITVPAEENYQDTNAVSTSDNDNDANGVPMPDDDDRIFSLLSKLAHRVVKIETNQKAHDRRMERLETGINLILDALSVDRSHRAIQSRPPLNAGPPGALLSDFKKIATVAELNAFEDKLKNPVFYKEAVRFTIHSIY